MMLRKMFSVCASAFLLALAAPASDAAEPATPSGQPLAQPPAQPPTGPGGSAAAHAAIRSQRFGRGATGEWIFVPDAPAEKAAPVVVFLHGWGGTDPNVYGAWIEHIVRRGAIVVYPLYQEGFRAKPDAILPNALAGVRDGLARLRRGDMGVRPDLSRFALVGHSAGGMLAANLAAIAAQQHLPKAGAVLAVSPGLSVRNGKTFIPTEKWEDIPADTLLVTMAGADDRIVGAADAQGIYARATRVPATNKDYLIVHSDAHGAPALKAEHSFATAPAQIVAEEPAPKADRGRLIARILANRASRGGEKGAGDNAGAGADGMTHIERTVDALDFYGTWKIFDALTDAAFFGVNRSTALGGGHDQLSMGKWRDGAPVAEMAIGAPH